jgi:Tfp pilus assembly protein PilN
MKHLAPLQIDFSQRPRRFSSVGLMLLGGGALATAISFTDFEAARAALMQQSKESSSIEQMMSDIRRIETRNEKLTPTEQRLARTAAGIARELRAPWIELLTMIEAMPLQDATLLSVEPLPATQTVRIVAEAKSPQAMLRLIQQLHKDVGLHQVTVMSHQVMANTPGAPLRFNIQAGWSGS